MFSSVAADKLRNDLATDRRPDVIDSILIANFFGLIQGRRAVSVRDDESWRSAEGLSTEQVIDIHMISREYAQGTLKCWSDVASVHYVARPSKA